jgi:hypothetical protein
MIILEWYGLVDLTLKSTVDTMYRIHSHASVVLA